MRQTLGNGCMRFPRTRGDRPIAGRQHPLYRIQVPPHTRGYDHLSRGSPAHAGIDLCPKRRCQRRFPRTRGDRPFSRPHRMDRQAWGSPAHAGIDPSCAGAPLRLQLRFPRTRGDRPVLSQSRGFARFPRTRGDRPSTTRLWDVWTRQAWGSPAHAGIDPSSASIALQARFPRTRGDRPQCSSSKSTVYGWTRPWGSPAHAGIDLNALPLSAGSAPVPPHTRG